MVFYRARRFYQLIYFFKTLYTKTAKKQKNGAKQGKTLPGSVLLYKIIYSKKTI